MFSILGLVVPRLNRLLHEVGQGKKWLYNNIHSFFSLTHLVLYNYYTVGRRTSEVHAPVHSSLLGW